MKKYIKQWIKTLVRAVVAAASRNKLGGYALEEGIAALMGQTQTVDHNSLSIRLSVPNRLCRYRADTFSTKEPDTLQWIDSIPKESILWDVGANVGLYSIYAAASRNCQVFAFEPSVFNLELLARNINLNGVVDRISIFPLALNDSLGVNPFRLSTTSWGGALSSYAHDVNENGDEMKSVLEYRLIGLTMDQAAGLLKIGLPDYIKIDVDGIEHLLLSGGASVLRHVKSVLIELPGVWEEQTQGAHDVLVKAGLKLIQDHSYHPIKNPTASANQIWSR